MIKKRIISMWLVVTMLFTMMPFTAFATEEKDSVYISISDDSKYVLDESGNPIAYKEVELDELSAIDLADYGLGGYVYDADNDGVNEITALHLYIYIHENVMGLDWSDVITSGGVGSIYFQGNLFGFSDENMRYDYNGAYPSVDGWGLTADQIVLKDNDYLNVAHYSSWAFWGDSATGFHYFADESGEVTYNYYAQPGENVTLNLVRSFSDWMNGGIPAFANEPYYDVHYGETYDSAKGSATTDDDGSATITAPTKAGKYYVWADGGYGSENPMDIVSAPAIAILTVTENPDVAMAKKVEDKILAIGTVTSNSKNAIEEARKAYDELTDAQKELVTNYDVLVNAENALANIDLDIEKANEVKAKISSIGKVTINSGKKITGAIDAYNALTDSQQEYVDNIDVLVDAISELENLYAKAGDVDHKAILEATNKFMLELGTPSVGSVGGEWMVIALTRGGYECPKGYYENVVNYVKAEINDKEQLHRSKSTDNSRVILALTSAGYDVTNVAGHNLLMGLTDMKYVEKQGINGPIWALIAFDSHNYDIPVNKNASEQVTREKLIEVILDNQFEDGGWAMSGQVADTDMTAMAIQSLAPYYETNETVKEAVDKALVCLSNKQDETGGFGSIDGICSESSAQVIVALTSLGINPETDSRFVKTPSFGVATYENAEQKGISVVDAMCQFFVEGGGFAHIPGGELNGMATEQSQYALVSYFRLLDGKTSLYDMSDVEIRENETLPDNKDEKNEELNGEDKSKTPEMGDNGNMGLYIAVMAIGAMGVVVLKKQRRFDK